MSKEQTEAEVIGARLLRHWTSGTLVTSDLSEAGEAVARLEADNASLREQNTMLDEKLAEMEAQPLQPPVAQPDHLRDATKMMHPAKPLTDEEILRAISPNTWMHIEGEDKRQRLLDARAIETAHGIKEQT